MPTKWPMFFNVIRPLPKVFLYLDSSQSSQSNQSRTISSFILFKSSTNNNKATMSFTNVTNGRKLGQQNNQRSFSSLFFLKSSPINLALLSFFCFFFVGTINCQTLTETASSSPPTLILSNGVTSSLNHSTIGSPLSFSTTSNIDPLSSSSVLIASSSTSSAPASGAASPSSITSFSISAAADSAAASNGVSGFVPYVPLSGSVTPSGSSNPTESNGGFKPESTTHRPDTVITYSRLTPRKPAFKNPTTVSANIVRFEIPQTFPTQSSISSSLKSTSDQSGNPTQHQNGEQSQLTPSIDNRQDNVNHSQNSSSISPPPSVPFPPPYFDFDSNKPSSGSASSGSLMKSAKRFFRKKVITSFEIKRKPSGKESGRLATGTTGGNGKIVVLPSGILGGKGLYQLPKPGTLIRNGFGHGWKNPLKHESTNGIGFPNILQRLRLRRRFDDFSVAPAPVLSLNNGSPGNRKNAWWTKYLTGSDSGTTSGFESSNNNNNNNNQMQYFNQDYVQNPVLPSGGLLPEYQSQPSNPIGASSGTVMDLLMGRMQPSTSSTGSSLSYTDLAMLAAQQQNQQNQQQTSQGLASQIRALYGRNKIPFRQRPARKFLSKLTSPYTYYAYKALQDSYLPAPAFTSTSPFLQSNNNVPETMINDSMENTNNNNDNKNRNSTVSSSSSSSSVVSVSESQNVPTYYRQNSFDNSPSHHHHYHYSPPQSVVRTFNYPRTSNSDNSDTPNQSSGLYRQYSLPHSVTHQIHPGTLQHSTPTVLDESKLSIIKFSAKDSIDGSRLGGSGGENRDIHSQIMRSGETFNSEQQLMMASNDREPKRVKMGSFVKPRSLWKSEGDFLEKYDMSDIFCKTKFKPIINPRPPTMSNYEDLERNGRFLKRSSAANNNNKKENNGEESVITSETVKFVNSNWAPVRTPRAMIIHNTQPRISLNIAGNHSSESSASQLESMDKQSLSSPEVLPFGSDFLKRSKRSTGDYYQADNPQPKPRLTRQTRKPQYDGELVLDNLPTGTVVKEIDPKMTELLLRLLRNTSAKNDFSQKKITNVFYLYLPNSNFKKNSELQNRTTTESSSPETRTNVQELPTVAPYSYDHSSQEGPGSQRPQRPPTSNNRLNRPRIPHRGRRPTTTTTTTTTTERPTTTTRTTYNRPRPTTQAPSTLNNIRIQTTTTTTTEAPPTSAFPTYDDSRRLISGTSSQQNGQTSSTGFSGSSASGFMLSEQDYDYAEKLCEGNFDVSIADPRHECRLYFQCNANTIDTYACPEHYRFDTRSQTCVPARNVYCPRP